MTERPLLILPVPGIPIVRQNKRGGGGQFGVPSCQRQAERLAPKFQILQDAFERKQATLRTDVTGIMPEDVLVLETVGTVANFLSALRKIDGMEWMGEIEQENIPPDDDFFNKNNKDVRTDKPMRGTAFLVFTNHRAWVELKSLWERWQRGEPLDDGLAPFKTVFTHLHNIRSWGVQERLQTTGVMDDWRDRLAHHTDDPVPCEIELWYRKDQTKRELAEEQVRKLINQQRGKIIARSIIEAIGYHAILVEVPAAAVSKILDDGQNVQLAVCEQIQFFRAAGQMAVGMPLDGNVFSDSSFLPDFPPSGIPPVAALLDGMPLQSHERLSGRLRIDDPDNFEADYQASERCHGTAMASLILWGDLDANDSPVNSPLYVRPIMKPDARNWLNHPKPETVPEKTLVVDLIYRSVRRMFDGDGEEPASAESVCLINLSIGIRDRLFDGALSPLARLLDWLSWQYKVLFLVSAGNHAHQIELNISSQAYKALPPTDRPGEILKAVAADARNRKLLSPAEAMNVLTVAAVHADHSHVLHTGHLFDPFPNMQDMPSPINAQGMGFRRAIKPDILVDGGRVMLSEHRGTTSVATLKISSYASPPGQKIASPGTLGSTSAVQYSRGTSHATALATRSGIQLFEMLNRLRAKPGGELLESVPWAIWLKALLVHSADWRTAQGLAESILKTPENKRQFKEYLTRLLGFGRADVTRTMGCTDYRVTVLGGGSLGEEQAHIHRFPLPPSLSGKVGIRRLIITLAWFTPVNPNHQEWRRAELWFSPPPPKHPLNINRKQAEWRAVQRGTVQHEILAGDKAYVFQDGDHIEIQVNCKADAGALEDVIPYSLVVTLEVDSKIDIKIYDEIRARIHAARISVSSGRFQP